MGINAISIFHLFWLIPGSLVIAAFINYVADVLPISRSLSVKPACVNCKQTFDFINYSTNKRCLHCQTKRSPRLMLVYIFIPLLFSAVFFLLGSFTRWLMVVVVLLYLSIIFLIDVEHRLILHSTSIVGAILFFVIGTVHNGLVKTVLGGAAGFALMYILYLFGILFNRWISNRRGELIEEAALGYGDVNLSGVLGLLLGWPSIGVCLFFAILGGGIFSGVWLLSMLIRRKYEAFTPIPYAPFLIISSLFLFYLSLGISF